MHQAKVLIVDDNVGGRYALARALRDGGYEVAEASSGTECLQRAGDPEIGLILLDINLPDVNGMDVCRLLKAATATAHIPVIQVSAYFTDRRDRVEGLESGADAYLSTPFEPRELLAHVKALLRMRRAEAQLQEREQWLQRLYSANVVGLVRADIGGRVYEANEEFLRIIGYSRQDLEEGRINWKTLTPEEYEAPEARLAEKLLKGAESISLEKEYTRKDGTRVPVLVGGTHLGRGMGIAMVVDLTEQKRKELALRESEAEFRAMFTVASVGKAQADPGSGRFLRVNAAFCRITGYSEAELLGRTLREITHPEDRDKNWESFQRLVAGETAAYEVEKRYVRPDGKVVWVQVSATLIRDTQGKALRTTAVIQDITQRKLAEQELQKTKEELAEANALLERKVAERTAQLQETVHQLEQYSYSISHDMKAPLRAMSQFSEILLEDFGGKVGEDGRMYLERIMRAAQRLDRLINDVLTYHRLTQAEVTLTPVDLDTLVRDIIQQYPKLQTLKADIEVRSPLLPVQGNVAALTQCVSNLLGNAVKFVEQGVEPRVKIWTERRDGWVRVWVEDNGIGVPPGQFDRIWGIFQQGHTGKSYEGTGIGLSIVKKAVERMSGRVGVESGAGTGSRFWFELGAVN